jgi:hypothetical protein
LKMSPYWVANIATTREHLTGTSLCRQSRTLEFAFTGCQVQSCQITSIWQTERLCWKPSTSGNTCQHRDQAKDALAFAGEHYRPARQRAIGIPVGQSEGKRGATFIDVAVSWICTLTCYCYRRPDCAPCVRQHTRRREWCTSFQEGVRCGSSQLARTCDVGGKSFMQVKV